MKDVKKYPFDLRPLTHGEGGGYLVSFTDFNECVADGETVEEAIAEGYQALAAVIDILCKIGPPPYFTAIKWGSVPTYQLHSPLDQQ